MHSSGFDGIQCFRTIDEVACSELNKALGTRIERYRKRAKDTMERTKSGRERGKDADSLDVYIVYEDLRKFYSNFCARLRSVLLLLICSFLAFVFLYPVVPKIRWIRNASFLPGNHV